MLEGRDVVGVAQTGTGKTAAFVLPLLNRIAENGAKTKRKTCTTLIVTPTRELAAQIADSVRTYGRHVTHSVAVVVGGVGAAPQVRALARGVDILVATPGRLLDHIANGALSLADTSTVVLDEADQMMDFGFIPDIRRIMAHLPDTRQTMLLSATMPKQIRKLANDFLNDPLEISVAPAARPIDLIDQKVFLVEKQDKTRVLVDYLRRNSVKRTIVFTRTKRGADKVTTSSGKIRFGGCCDSRQ